MPSRRRYREAVAKVAEASLDEVVKTCNGKSGKTKVKPSKIRHMSNLKQFHIGQFEASVNMADLKWLQRMFRREC